MPPVRLSIIVPVFNEATTIEAVLDRIRAATLSGVEREIVVVDDGSTDGTRDILAGMAGRECHIVYHDRNRGKGAAVRTGLAHASGDYVLIQDADFEYNPADYARLLAPVAAGADCVYGSRLATGGDLKMAPLTVLANRFLSWMTRRLYGVRLTDMETCYKLVRRDLLASIQLKADRFDIEPEITAKLARRGVAIHEVPIRYEGRSRAEGKKIGWRDGAEAMWTLIKYRFVD